MTNFDILSVHTIRCHYPKAIGYKTSEVVLIINPRV